MSDLIVSAPGGHVSEMMKAVMLRNIEFDNSFVHFIAL